MEDGKEVSIQEEDSLSFCSFPQSGRNHALCRKLRKHEEENKFYL